MRGVIAVQANGPDRLPENKLLQAQLNLDNMRARGEITQEQYNQLAVAAKLATAQNWLAHDGKINPDGTISYRNVPVDSKVALGVAYADAKRYWDKETHLSPQEIAQAAKDLAMGVYDFFIGDDIKTLQDPNASLFSKVLAGGSLALTFGGGFVEKAGLRVVSSGVKYLFKDVKLITRVTGSSPEIARTLNRVWGFNKKEIANYDRFVKQWAEDYPVEIYKLPNGGKGLVTIKPPAGHHANTAIVEQYFDEQGKQIFLGKRVINPDGTVKNFKQKFPITDKGDKFLYSERDYWQHLKRVFKDFGTQKGK